MPPLTRFHTFCCHLQLADECAMAKKGNGPPAGEPWCWYTREMLLAPAFREASINCRRLISALEVENVSHAGTENGNLKMPYNQLVRWWHIPRRLIRRTIDEAIERGLGRGDPWIPSGVREVDA